MSDFKNFIKTMKHANASRYVFDEKEPALKVDIDKLYDKDFDGIPGSDVVDLAISLLKQTHEEHSVKSTIMHLKVLQDEKDIYEPVLDFLLKYSDRGPEIYMAMEQGKISPEKQWEVDLIAKENYILGGNETDEKVRYELLSAVARTETPIPVQQISGFISRDTARIIESELMSKLSERYDNLREKGYKSAEIEDILRQELKGTAFVLKENELGMFELEGTGLFKGAHYIVNERTVELFKLAHVSERIMQAYLDSGFTRATDELSKEQTDMTLKTYIRIAQKYQGAVREKERDVDYVKDDDKKKMPPIKQKILAEHRGDIQNTKENEPDFGGTIYEPGPGSVKLPEIEYNKINEERKYGSYIQNPVGPYVEDFTKKEIEMNEFDTIDEIPMINGDEIKIETPEEMPTYKPKMQPGDIIMDGR